MHKTLAGWVSSSEWLHSENAGVKGVWEGSLGFLEGQSAPTSAWAPSLPALFLAPWPPVAAGTEGYQVGPGRKQLPSPNIPPPQGLFLDPLNGERGTALGLNPVSSTFQPCQVFACALPGR